MTSREKVLLGLCATAAIGGAVYYGMDLLKPPKKTPVAQQDFTPIITRVGVELKNNALTDREQRVLAAATTRWLRNPLRSQPLEKQPEKATEPDEPLPNYVGFINIGDRPIAIIDGQDYRLEETIKGGVYKLTAIFPDHIELLRNGANEAIKIPLEKVTPPGEPQ